MFLRCRVGLDQRFDRDIGGYLTGIYMTEKKGARELKMFFFDLNQKDVVRFFMFGQRKPRNLKKFQVRIVTSPNLTFGARLWRRLC